LNLLFQSWNIKRGRWYAFPSSTSTTELRFNFIARTNLRRPRVNQAFQILLEISEWRKSQWKLLSFGIKSNVAFFVVEHHWIDRQPVCVVRRRIECPQGETLRIEQQTDARNEQKQSKKIHNYLLIDCILIS